MAKSKELTATTRFKVINNAGSHFKLSMQGTVTGRMYYTPGQFDTYYGHADLSLDIRTYPGWKGELRSFLYENEVPTGDPNYVRMKGTYTSYYLMPWSGYDLSQLGPDDLPIQSCILSYHADYLVSDERRTADVNNVEIIPTWDDLSGLQGRIGDYAKPYFSRFRYAAGGSTRTRVNRESIYIKTPLPFNYVTPIHMIDGVRYDIYSGGTYTVTSSVNIELVE